jgi:hypothetical protein
VLREAAATPKVIQQRILSVDPPFLMLPPPSDAKRRAHQDESHGHILTRDIAGRPQTGMPRRNIWLADAASSLAHAPRAATLLRAWQSVASGFQACLMPATQSSLWASTRLSAFTSLGKLVVARTRGTIFHALRARRPPRRAFPQAVALGRRYGDVVTYDYCPNTAFRGIRRIAPSPPDWSARLWD